MYVSQSTLSSSRLRYSWVPCFFPVRVISVSVAETMTNSKSPSYPSVSSPPLGSAQKCMSTLYVENERTGPWSCLRVYLEET